MGIYKQSKTVSLSKLLLGRRGRIFTFFGTEMFIKPNPTTFFNNVIITFIYFIVSDIFGNLM